MTQEFASEDFTSEELAQLAAAGFVENEHGEMVLWVVMTKTNSWISIESPTDRPPNGMLIVKPGGVEETLRSLGKL